MRPSFCTRRKTAKFAFALCLFSLAWSANAQETHLPVSFRSRERCVRKDRRSR